MVISFGIRLALYAVFSTWIYFQHITLPIESDHPINTVFIHPSIKVEWQIPTPVFSSGICRNIPAWKICPKWQIWQIWKIWFWSCNKTKPTTWWASVDRSSTVNNDLCQVAVKLLKMPSSSASIERVFSNFGLIQTKLRNRLGLQKAAKLVFCYRYFRGNAEIDW